MHEQRSATLAVPLTSGRPRRVRSAHHRSDGQATHRRATQTPARAAIAVAVRPPRWRGPDTSGRSPQPGRVPPLRYGAYSGTRNLRAVQVLLGHASIATTEGVHRKIAGRAHGSRERDRRPDLIAAAQSARHPLGGGPTPSYSVWRSRSSRLSCRTLAAECFCGFSILSSSHATPSYLRKQ